jgi:hypothetical protein
MERLTDLLAKAGPILQVSLPAIPPDLFHPSQPLTNEGGSSLSTKP